eukprot:Nitzschia sp. Nitz4//scaffold62_size106224//12901//14739//NITZ4_004342-RA/size106224-processed-gene-0.46-mRNA-1//-1//CDS//3329555814//1481//frame0
MASTPPPPAGDNNNNSGEWRQSVLQSYRNEEVREIAKVLASLEPGATASSKLMLAMRFEDTIFKAADSLADYRKKMTKRLKKLQKNYVPPAQQQTKSTETEVLLVEMRQKYGESLQYIAKNADRAIKDVSARSGTERSSQLRQHTDSAIQWGRELGVLDNIPVARVAQRLSEAQIQKIQQHLERRVENIRQYVVKHADPDLFLQETVERKDSDMPERANKMLSVNLVKRIEQLQQQTASMAGSTSNAAPADSGASSSTKFEPLTVLQESLDKAQAAVPPPTRNNSNDIPAALMHLDKMRAASTALMAYFSMEDRKTTAPRNALTKSCTVVSSGLEFVSKVAQTLPKPPRNQVTLQDAWTKVLEIPTPPEEVVTSENPEISQSALPSTGAAGSSTNPPPAKRIKRSQDGSEKYSPPVTRCRVLLRPDRKIPTSLIPALRRKRAKLVRPPLGSRGSYLILEFGTAFTLTIYFCPLLVTIRAQTPPTPRKAVPRHTPVTTQRTQGCAHWTPLYHGLTDLPTPDASSTQQQQGPLRVWGVNGTYETIGRVVEERLQDASMHATQVLRQCFRGHVKDKTAEFEVEILEASALLEFLQLARTTYMPNWQDDEDEVVVQ